MLRITAAICTYNRERYLRPLFEKLVQQTLPLDQWEVVLVDNNSPGNTREIYDEFMRHYPDFPMRYVLETHQGLSHARNRSIAESNAPLITFLDDDAYPADDYFEKCCYYLENNKLIQALGSKILLTYEGHIPRWKNKYVDQILGYYDLGNTIKILQWPDYPRGSNMTFKTSVFHTVGLFNVELGRKGGNMTGGEEKDLFARLYQQFPKGVCYVPDAIVYHFVPESRIERSFIRQQAIGIGRSERIRSKNNGKAHYFAAIVREILKWIATLGVSAGYALRGRFAAAWMLLRFRAWVSAGLFSGED